MTEKFSSLGVANHPVICADSGDFAEQVNLPEISIKSEVESVLKRLRVRFERQPWRRSSEGRMDLREELSKLFQILAAPRVTQIEVECGLTRTVKTRRHPADDDEINVGGDQAIDDRLELDHGWAC